MQSAGHAVPGPGLAGRLAPDGGSVAAAASDPSLSSSRRHLWSWKLHPAVTDGKFRGACNISEKQRGTLFGWKLCSWFCGKSMPACRMWRRGTEHGTEPSHPTSKWTLFTGLVFFSGDGTGTRTWGFHLLNHHSLCSIKEQNLTGREKRFSWLTCIWMLIVNTVLCGNFSLKTNSKYCFVGDYFHWLP